MREGDGLVYVRINEKRGLVLEYLARECGTSASKLAEHMLGVTLDSERIRLAMSQAPPIDDDEPIRFNGVDKGEKRW